MNPTTETTTSVCGRVRIQHGAKRVCAYLGGEIVANTIHPLLVWEKPYYPAYYFPLEDVRTELLSRHEGGVHSPSRGDARAFTIRAGGKEAAGAALRYEESPFEELRDAIRLEWNALHAWFEEDEQVYKHPRNPYTRVDIVASSRQVRIEVGESRSRRRAGRRSSSRQASPCATTCRRRTCAWSCSSRARPSPAAPYKGDAAYCSLRGGPDDVAWSTGRRFPRARRSPA